MFNIFNLYQPEESVALQFKDIPKVNLCAYSCQPCETLSLQLEQAELHIACSAYKPLVALCLLISSRFGLQAW